MDTSHARTAILERVRNAAPTSPSAGSTHASWLRIARNYRQQPSRNREECLKLFADRLRDYEAHVHSTDFPNIVQTIAQVLVIQQIETILLPNDLPRTYWPNTVLRLFENNLSPGEMNECDAVLTTARFGIAETGSIVLQARHPDLPGQGSRTTALVPDCHICIVHEDAVVETVPEAMRKLLTHLPTTFISGPSATADIEMTRIRGVHGPRYLHVILVASPNSE